MKKFFAWMAISIAILIATGVYIYPTAGGAKTFEFLVYLGMVEILFGLVIWFVIDFFQS